MYSYSDCTSQWDVCICDVRLQIKLWYCCLLPQRKARSNLTHWFFVVRESSYHEQDSIARYRYMVLDIVFFVFGWFKVIILKMYHKVASILLHKCCYIYLSLRDWNTRECSSVSFTLSGKLKKRIKRKREFWAGYCYACWVFIDNAV